MRDAVREPVTHVLTVHWQDPRWIEPQRRHVRRYIPNAEVWGSLDGIDRAWDDRVDHATRLDGTHAEKLNELARRASAAAEPTDRLLFLDGDAFPIAPVLPALLEGVALAAVRRDENLGDPQPHPCFCLTTVATWAEIGGDWREGYTWINAAEESVSDVGAELLRVLRERNLAWRALLRSNLRDLDPLLFAVYGDVVYHHGAGFRADPTRLHATARRRRRRAARDLAARTPGRIPRAAVYRGATLWLRTRDRLTEQRGRVLDHRVRRHIERDDLGDYFLTPSRVRRRRDQHGPASVIVRSNEPTGAVEPPGAAPSEPPD